MRWIQAFPKASRSFCCLVSTTLKKRTVYCLSINKMPETKSNAKQCANRTWWESKYPDKYNEHNSNYYYPDPPSLFNLGNIFGSKPKQYKGDFKGKCNHTRHYREDRSPSIVVGRSRLRDAAPTDYSRQASKSSLRRYDSRRSYSRRSHRSYSRNHSRRSPEHRVGFLEQPRASVHVTPRASVLQKPFANHRSSVELRDQKPFANHRSSVELRDQKPFANHRSSVELRNSRKSTVKFEEPTHTGTKVNFEEPRHSGTKVNF